MDKYYTLVKFLNSNNIYFTCYNHGNNHNFILPFLIDWDTLKKKYYCCIGLFYEDYFNKSWNYAIAENKEIEIYADYEEGIFWNGTANEKERVIKDGLFPKVTGYNFGKPNWAKNFMEEHWYEKFES